MNRRSFFKLFGAGAATLALSEAIPFGRVWSFPSKIVVPETRLLTVEEIRESYLTPAAKALAREIDLSIRSDLAILTGRHWPPLPARETAIALNRACRMEFDLVPA